MLCNQSTVTAAVEGSYVCSLTDVAFDVGPMLHTWGGMQIWTDMDS